MSMTQSLKKNHRFKPVPLPHTGKLSRRERKSLARCHSVRRRLTHTPLLSSAPLCHASPRLALLYDRQTAVNGLFYSWPKLHWHGQQQVSHFKALPDHSSEDQSWDLLPSAQPSSLWSLGHLVSIAGSAAVKWAVTSSAQHKHSGHRGRLLLPHRQSHALASCGLSSPLWPQI